jgi:hypothetical protein
LFGQFGNDALIGGPGADTLSGGEGADTFRWFRSDVFQAGETQVPVDVITDFDLPDVLDLTWLLPWRSPEPIDNLLSLRREGDDTVLAVDQDGSGGAYGFADFVRLENFATAVSLQDLIDDGVILIP